MHPSAPGTAGGDLFARVARALAPAYELERELGRGGMAVVFAARDTRLKRGVAVKLLPPDLAFQDGIRTRFLREAEMAAGLSHPNIVPIYLVDERDGLVFFVMALVEGGSVGDRLRRDAPAPMPVADARRIVREVAGALDYAHARGVVHRDIKPDNILLDAPTGRAMVTDFGIARAASDGQSRLTSTGAALGTPAYMSPEQCAGERELDGRSDLYSLGAVAYHMLTGVAPFSGGNTQAIMMKQVSEPPVPLTQRRADVPPDLERIVLKLLAKDPAQRFATGAEVIAAIDGAPVAAPRDSATVGMAPHGVHIGISVGGRIRQRSSERRLAKAEKERQKKLEEEQEERELTTGPIPNRVKAFQKALASGIGGIVFFSAINFFTSRDFWWAAFPTLYIVLDLGSKFSKLWMDGVRPRDIFRRPAALQSSPVPSGSGSVPAERGAPPLPEVPAGPRAAALRQAESDRRTIDDVAAQLSDAERGQLPDVRGTARDLQERMVALASALDRLDAEIGTDRRPELDGRISQIEQSGSAPGDQERRLQLLRRQRAALDELVQSRSRLIEQFESAELLLRNLALGVLTLRSAGLKSSPGDVTSITQEAQALAREIGYVLSANEEVRKLGADAREAR
ncbi:MAG TPA: serine/threonine-protein kinase [Gemmatimonadaceae bacterium]|nr:serine/threonine-protein kinase [Gemmatimonadaceae bacterium]